MLGERDDGQVDLGCLSRVGAASQCEGRAPDRDGCPGPSWVAFDTTAHRAAAARHRVDAVGGSPAVMSPRSTMATTGSTMTTSALTAHPTKLRRSLGLWAIVGLGLGYMTPMTVFDTFGYFSEESGGV